jgi:hypothetical protein
MRCGGQRACNPSSSQRQFEHRFGANAALADRPGISAPGAELPRPLRGDGSSFEVTFAFRYCSYQAGEVWLSRPRRLISALSDP